ncbi:MAG: hypothetical protein WD294_07470 [Phycisphaeraceae bacterium]
MTDHELYNKRRAPREEFERLLINSNQMIAAQRAVRQIETERDCLRAEVDRLQARLSEASGEREQASAQVMHLRNLNRQLRSRLEAAECEAKQSDRLSPHTLAFERALQDIKSLTGPGLASIAEDAIAEVAENAISLLQHEFSRLSVAMSKALQPYKSGRRSTPSQIENAIDYRARADEVVASNASMTADYGLA